MKSVTLNVSGMKFPNAFNTVVNKVINPDKDSSIVLDAAPNIEISLGAETAASLGIEKRSRVSIKPVDGSSDGSFTLEVGEKEAPTKAAAQPNRGSSPARSMHLSNSLD